jgi:hypothetical protein
MAWDCPAVDQQTCCTVPSSRSLTQNRSTLSASKRAHLLHHRSRREARFLARCQSLLPPSREEIRLASTKLPRYAACNAPLGDLKANSDLNRRWFSMGIRLHSSLLPSTLPMAIRHLDSSGKAVIPRLPIGSTQKICLVVLESPLLPRRDDPRSKNFNVRRVSRTATCSRANKSKNTIQHQYP